MEIYEQIELERAERQLRRARRIERERRASAVKDSVRTWLEVLIVGALSYAMMFLAAI